MKNNITIDFLKSNNNNLNEWSFFFITNGKKSKLLLSPLYDYHYIFYLRELNKNILKYVNTILLLSKKIGRRKKQIVILAGSDEVNNESYILWNKLLKKLYIKIQL